MGLLSKIFSNTRKPEGFFGRMMVNGMNGGGHARLAEWGLSFLDIDADAIILDVGCGGGANIARLLKRCPQGKVTGIDYSPVYVAKSRKVNAAAISSGRCKVVEGSASALPFGEDCFDLVTAFETVYFWPDIEECFRGVCKILKKMVGISSLSTRTTASQAIMRNGRNSLTACTPTPPTSSALSSPPQGSATLLSMMTNCTTGSV